MVELTLSKLVTGFIVFILLIFSGFMAYTGFLGDNEVTYSSSINESELEDWNEQVINISRDVEDNRSATPSIAGLDILITGVDSIKAVFDALPLMNQMISFIQNDTLLKRIPAVVWGLVTAILVFIIVFVVIGAIWRYRMQG